MAFEEQEIALSSFSLEVMTSSRQQLDAAEGRPPLDGELCLDGPLGANEVIHQPLSW